MISLNAFPLQQRGSTPDIGLGPDSKAESAGCSDRSGVHHLPVVPGRIIFPEIAAAKIKWNTVRGIVNTRSQVYLPVKGESGRAILPTVEVCIEVSCRSAFLSRYWIRA